MWKPDSTAELTFISQFGLVFSQNSEFISHNSVFFSLKIKSKVKVVLRELDLKVAAEGKI